MDGADITSKASTNAGGVRGMYTGFVSRFSIVQSLSIDIHIDMLVRCAYVCVYVCVYV